MKPRRVHEAVQLVDAELSVLFCLFLGSLSQAPDQRLQLFDFEDLFGRDEFEESADQGFQGLKLKAESVPLAQPRRYLLRV